MLTINICIGSACHLKGSYSVISKLQELVKNQSLEDKVEIKGAFCLGRCTEAVSVKVDDKIYSVCPTTTEEFFNNEILTKLPQQ
ncbi:(2Fe-2S) ferredoxin domain-containing protein [Vallitalea maricola]|uniref:NAD(P)H-dependent oxidoreductase subunit E n=1 Tax=Vallitalea maricola TaxID=3074433 RepID=A0ACB5UN83_9FIRM|nr:NAD(P)H-dependent oxidoreductase subunit E [Vallitalea sp. AN17-2]